MWEGGTRPPPAFTFPRLCQISQNFGEIRSLSVSDCGGVAACTDGAGRCVRRRGLRARVPLSGPPARLQGKDKGACAFMESVLCSRPHSSFSQQPDRPRVAMWRPLECHPGEAGTVSPRGPLCLGPAHSWPKATYVERRAEGSPALTLGGGGGIWVRRGAKADV